jgi:hypothetical protein
MATAKTSIAAAKSVDMTALERRVLDTIDGYGATGCISDQVQHVLGTLSYSSVTARFKSLEEKGEIVRGPDTRAGVSGRQQLVMRAMAYAHGVPPPVTRKEKRSGFLSGVIFAAKIVARASDMVDAKRTLARELKALIAKTK